MHWSIPFLLFVAVSKSAGNPSPQWNASCGETFANLGVYTNFSSAVAHVVHSITVEDIKHFFDVSLGPENGIPNANTDLGAGDDDIILLHAPSRPGDPNIKSPGFYTFTQTMDHMGDPEFGMKENVLARMAHNFRMHEMWTKVNVETEKFGAVSIDPAVCGCALDVQGNGVVDDLEQIFLYFRDTFNQYPGGRPNIKNRRLSSIGISTFRLYDFDQVRTWKSPKDLESAKSRRLRPGRDGYLNLPVLNDVNTWNVWREMLDYSMLYQQEIRAAGLYMHCAIQTQK